MCALKVKKVVFVAIAAVVGLCFCAYGDGVFVWQKGVDLYGPSQKGIILYDEGVEDLILQVKYKGQASDFAWIVPVPSKPEVKAVDGDIFAEISEYTQHRGWWNAAYYFRKRGTPEEKVEVVERKKVSVYDVAILNAKDARALIKWLNDNGFSFPDKGRRILGDYIDRKWSFIALRIHPDEEKLWVEKSLNEGTLVPLKFTFACEEIVYPLKVSSLNRGETDVLLYVFYKDAVVHPDFRADAPPAGEFFFYSMDARSVLDARHFELWQRDRKLFAKFFDFERKFFRAVARDELPECRKALPRLNNKEFFLSKLRNTFKTEQMRYDIVLKPVDKLSPREKYYFVKRQAEADRAGEIKTEKTTMSFENSLLLLSREQVAEYIGKKLAQPAPIQPYSLRSGFEFLAHEPSKQILEVMRSAANHTDEHVRKDLAEGLYWRADRYGLDGKFTRILKRLCEGGAEAGDAFEALATMGNDEAMQLLSKYAVEPAFGWKRRSCLSCLLKFKKPLLIGVYGQAFDTGNLKDDEIFFCLKGLEHIDDPGACPLVERILRQGDSNRNARLARQLLARWEK
jgi:hypothetical protein